MNITPLRLLIGLSLAAAAFAADAPADKRAAALAQFDSARALFSTDINASVAGLRKSIEIDPDFCTGHQYFILYSSTAATRSLPATASDEEKKAASEKSRAATLALYENWAKEQPTRAAYQYALGSMFEYEDPDRAVRHFEAAVKLDPKCGDAFDMLGICAEVRGNLAQSIAYHRQSIVADPTNVTLWRHLIGSLREADVDEGVKLGREMQKRFPEDAAYIVSYLATRQRDEAKARQIFEVLRKDFLPAAAGNLTGLFSLYMKSDRPKALALAKEMAALVPKNAQWPVLVNYAQALVEADALIAAGKPAEATAALEKITLPRYGADARWLHLARAQATAAAGKTDKAYADLLGLMVKTPTDEMAAALAGYGQKLGKTGAQVDAELLAQRSAAAKPGIGFTLTNYYTGKPVSLDDYKGRVVMVNFWYPMCGPCRGEFPFLQAVLEKYRDRGFEILAINGHAPEDHMVQPLLKGWKLDFLPLKSDAGLVDKNYKVRGYPSNFLYGPDGRIFYEPPPVSTPAAARELEMQIEALLATTKNGGVPTVSSL